MEKLKALLSLWSFCHFTLFVGGYSYVGDHEAMRLCLRSGLVYAGNPWFCPLCLLQHCKNIKPSKHNLFLLDTLCYYLRCGSQHVKLPLYSVKVKPSGLCRLAEIRHYFLWLKCFALCNMYTLWWRIAKTGLAAQCIPGLTTALLL